MLFSGDHVMAWSTPVVAPPDGSMGDYMASLQKLAKRSEPIYFPGHGGAVRNAPRFVAAYILHRKAREASIVNRLGKGETDIPTLVRGDLCRPRPAADAAPPACRCWRISRIWWRAASSRPTAPPSIDGPLSLGWLIALAESARPSWRGSRLSFRVWRRSASLDILEQAADARGVGAEVVAAVARGRAHVDARAVGARRARGSRRRRGSP